MLRHMVAVREIGIYRFNDEARMTRLRCATARQANDEGSPNAYETAQSFVRQETTDYKTRALASIKHQSSNVKHPRVLMSLAGGEA